VLDINLIWFGYIARLSQWGGGGYFTYYLPSLRLEKGVGQHPVDGVKRRWRGRKMVFCREKLLDYWNAFNRSFIVLSNYIRVFNSKAINVIIIPP
jgi:hypothetical protein